TQTETPVHAQRHVHTRTETCTHTYIQTRIHTQARRHMYIHTDTCTYIHTYMNTHTDRHMYIHTDTYIHAYTCTCTHTPIKKLQYFIVHSQIRVLHSRGRQRAQHTLLALLSLRSAIE
ncbi:unnamed protein product, partial [Staurois parvus]